MKKIVIVIVIFIVLLSCEKKSVKKDISFTNFVFSMSAEHSEYSMKFTNSDTIFFEKRFPYPKEHFYSIIQKSDKDYVIKIVSQINFSKYDSIYDEYKLNHLVDGTGYKFYVENKSKKNWIYIYGDIGPKEFYDFANFLNRFKEKQQLHPTHKKIDFGNLNHILLPEPPEPKIINGH